MTSRPALRRIRRPAVLALLALVSLPATTSAHTLIGRYESPLPLAAYLGGAALAVALSFAIVILRGRPGELVADRRGSPGRIVPVPRWVRLGLRVLGLVAWAWIIAQGVVGGTSSDADVGSLFLWTYGWVALPIISAFIGPAWEWLDPFVTLHDLGAALLRRLGVRAWRITPYPAALQRWPAVAAFVVFVWLELVYTTARGGHVLALVVATYTAWTLLMMAQYGRDTWRQNGDAFTAWFGTVGRIAPLGLEGPGASRLRVRPIGAGLLEATWLRSELVLAAVATGSILFDGLSQTQFWFDLVGVPGLPAGTAQLLLFLLAITALVLAVARVAGDRAMAAGIVPIALGYLIAHYFTALAFDGQRLVTVISDPFNVGWNLFGTATFEPNETWLPFGIVWAIELVAVVGGHIGGAVMGHRAVAQPPAPTGQRADERRPAATGPWADARLRQVPLAVLMVVLTAATLWSLGQNLVHSAG